MEKKINENYLRGRLYQTVSFRVTDFEKHLIFKEVKKRNLSSASEFLRALVLTHIK